MGCQRGSVVGLVRIGQWGQYVLGKNVTVDCVANGGDASCQVGFVVASKFLLFYFCRCQLALAIKILVTLLGVGSKIGQGGGQMIVISKPMVVYGHAWLAWVGEAWSGFKDRSKGHAYGSD